MAWSIDPSYVPWQTPQISEWKIPYLWLNEWTENHKHQRNTGIKTKSHVLMMWITQNTCPKEKPFCPIPPPPNPDPLPSPTRVPYPFINGQTGPQTDIMVNNVYPCHMQFFYPTPPPFHATCSKFVSWHVRYRRIPCTAARGLTMQLMPQSGIPMSGSIDF